MVIARVGVVWVVIVSGHTISIQPVDFLPLSKRGSCQGGSCHFPNENTHNTHNIININTSS